MATLPTIYAIQATDASKNSDRLREILYNLKTENRIGGVTILGQKNDLSAVTDNVGEEDLILTNE